jgi:hypothetical protein
MTKSQVERRPSWRYECEHFTECRDRLMDVHGWDRAKATLAARAYFGVDSREQLCEMVRPTCENLMSDDGPRTGRPLREGDVHEIYLVR